MGITQSKQVCVIIGGNSESGAALAGKFAQKNYALALIGRNINGLNAICDKFIDAKAFECDVTSLEQVKSCFAQIHATYGKLDCVIYNIGKVVWGDVLETDEIDFERIWQVNALGAYQCIRAFLPNMLANKNGSIIFMSATAARRGGAKTAAFASAKFAQYGLAQSLARRYAAEGIHVAIIHIDAVIDTPEARARLSNRTIEQFANANQIAETAFMIANQEKSAWTFELDLRPHLENW